MKLCAPSADRRLTDDGIAVPTARSASALPATSRSPTFLFATPISWPLRSVGPRCWERKRSIIGAVEPDSSGYPDCRPAYYRAFNQVVKTGTKEGAIRIVTPLIAMHKAEIVRLGLELNAPFDLTWSCYSRQERACGVWCDSCILRLRAFAAAGVADPIPYAENSNWRLRARCLLIFGVDLEIKIR